MAMAFRMCWTTAARCPTPISAIATPTATATILRVGILVSVEVCITAVTPNLAFESSPPPVAEQVDFFTSSTPGPQGENGAVRVHFAPGQNLGPTVSMVVGSRLVVMHDTGTGADRTTGDGEYAARRRLRWPQS